MLLSLAAHRLDYSASLIRCHMHELSIAQSLLEMVLEIAAREGAVEIPEVQVRLGVLSCVRPQTLQRSFVAAAEGTPAESATLAFKRSPIRVSCDHCRMETEIWDVRSLRCPKCDAPAGKLSGGDEIELESVELIPTVVPKPSENET